MPVEINTSEEADILVMRVGGKLTSGDYERWEKRAREHGRAIAGTPSLLVEVRDLDGWDLSSGWQSLTERSDERFSQFEKVAFVGDERAEGYLGSFSQLFAHNEVRIFPLKEMNAALEWLRSGKPSEGISERSLP